MTPLLLLLRRGRPKLVERAQSTVEYALVLAAVTVLVGGVIAYFTADGGHIITALFGAAFAKMRSLAGG